MGEHQTNNVVAIEAEPLPTNVIDASAAFAARQELVRRARCKKAVIALAITGTSLVVATTQVMSEEAPSAEQPPSTAIIEAQTCALDAATLDTTEGQEVIEYPPGTFCTASGVLVIPVEPNYTG